MTGRTIVPEFVRRTKVEVVVPDTLAKQIINDILNSLSPGSTSHDMIFVKDVSEAYEIGTQQSGEAILLPK
jgi:nitrogen regulatory protein P-II 1